MTIIDTISRQKFLVTGVDTKRAMLAVFFREVLYKKTPEAVTWDLVEQELPAYEEKNCFRTKVIRSESGALSVLTEFWKYVVEEGLADAEAVDLPI
jgi:hypothetical protein